jgi:hypothetical protein
MKKFKLVIISLIWLIAALLASCSLEEVTEAPTSTVVAPVIQTATPTSTPQPSPTPTVRVPLDGKQTRYQLEVLVDYYNHYVTVKEQIHYTNKSQDTISELVLAVPPTNYQDVFWLISLADMDNHPISVFEWEGSRLHIPLDTPLAPNDQFSFKLNYSMLMPVREGSFGYSGRQMNLSNWYPFIPPWVEGKGWQVHDLWLVNSQIVGEHLVYEASDFEVTLEFTDRRENMKIAASTTANEADGVISYHLGLGRGIAFSISDVYISHQIEQDGVTIISYTFPEHTTSCIAAAEIAAQALKLYSELYGPYHRDLFTVVEADFFHGMEFDGMTLLSKGFYNFYDGTPLTNLTIITPHETSHQWFFSLVGNDQAIEPWLDEALATYSEVLYYERYHPENVQWWWDNRIYGQNPNGYVNTSIYLDQGYEVYRNGVYLRGAMFLQEIRDAVGDEAFFAAIKDYVSTKAYEIATSKDFFDALSRHSSEDISPILEEYFQP